MITDAGMGCNRQQWEGAIIMEDPYLVFSSSDK